ncbi:MAG: aldo/keto reductase, partial [Candidatus Dormibacteraceae bacterium]
LSISERQGFERYVTHQANYSLVARELEHELVPLCLDQGVGVLVWSPLAAGLLAGKQRRGDHVEEGTRRAWRGDTWTVDYDSAWATIDVLREIASGRGVSVAQVSLNWLLRRPAVSSVIVGARTQEQLEDNLQAASFELTPEEVERLDKASARPLPYPVWHQNRMNPAQLVYRQREPDQY